MACGDNLTCSLSLLNCTILAHDDDDEPVKSVIDNWQKLHFFAINKIKRERKLRSFKCKYLVFSSHYTQISIQKHFIKTFDYAERQWMTKNLFPVYWYLKSFSILLKLNFRCQWTKTSEVKWISQFIWWLSTWLVI